MKLRVVRTFQDKKTYKMYAVGEIIILPDERASKAIERGLAVEIAMAKSEITEPTENVKPKKAKKEEKGNARESKTCIKDND